MVGVDPSEVDAVRGEPDREEEQAQLHDELRHGAQHAPCCDRFGELQAVLLQESHLHSGVRRDRDRQVRERERALQLDARPDGQSDGNAPEERHAVRRVGQRRQHHRERDPTPARVADGVPELGWVTHSAQERADGDERADAHEEPAHVEPRERPELRRLDAERSGGGLAQCCERSVELRAAAERVVGPPGQRGGLEERERGAQTIASDTPLRGRDRPLRPGDRRRRGQRVRHVGRELRVADARRGTVETDEQRFAVLHQEVVTVELAVRDPGVLKVTDEIPDPGEQAAIDRVVVEIEQRGARRSLFDK